MRVLLPLPILVPLVAAGISMALFRWPALQRALGAAVMVAVVVTSVILLVEVDNNGIAATQLGGWPAPTGITLVADLFSAAMLVVGTVTVLLVLVYAIGQPGTSETSPWFHPIYLVLAAGIAACFLTGDLFNLFVAFEVMLSASYVLITLGGTRDQVRTGMTYVVINIVASTLFLTAIGLVYAATGTVNMADLAGRLADLPDGVRNALGLLLLVVFGVKAAIFPLFFWLPDSYPTAPSPVTAIFAGLLTKVGVYSIIRTQTLLFPDDGNGSLLLFLAGATMVVGILGAVAQNDLKRILSFHIVSQIGYMIMGLGLFTVAGLAGAILFTIHQVVVKTSLFLVGGLVEHLGGTSLLARLGGMARRAPLVAALFLLPALSLAGLPPFSGFVAKLALVQAGLAVDAWLIVAVSLAVSALTLFSMTKIWSGAFWGTSEALDWAAEASGGRLRAPGLMVGATAALVIVSLGIAVAGGPAYALSERAARELLTPGAYVEAVLGG